MVVDDCVDDCVAGGDFVVDGDVVQPVVRGSGEGEEVLK